MTPPVTRPYEMALLRAVFSPEKARELIHVGSAKLFGDDDTKLFYKAFQRLHFDRIPVTKESLLLEVQSRALIPDENASILIDEILLLPEPAKVKHLADGLGKLRSRALLHEMNEFLQSEEATKGGIGPAVAKMNEFIAAAHIVSAKKPETLSETMERIMGRVGQEKVWGPGMGMDDVWPIRKGSYTIIGADSGSGKTSMLLNIALSIARQDTHIGIISIEMTSDEVTYRMAAMEAGVDSAHIEDNVMTPAERQMVLYKMQENRAIYDRVHVIDPSYVSAEDLHGYYNTLITQHGCEVIALDYLQKVGTKDKLVHSKTEAVAHASEAITAITKSTGVATIALSVLSRDMNSGKSTKKGLDHLKHSGQPGHDASTVVILSMEDRGEGLSDDIPILVEAVKVRKGKWFKRGMILNGPTQRMVRAAIVFE